MTRSLRSAFVLIGLSIALCHAQPAFASVRRSGKQAPIRARTQTTGTGEVNLTATSANVKESGSLVSIRILRWSTDEERNPVVAAMNPAAPSTAPAGAAGGSDAAARGRRGGAGRGGRGGVARGRGDAGAPPTPMAALTAALSRAPTVGYIWTNDVTGYSIKYAHHTSLPDGSERVILATDRRLGGNTASWKPVAPAPSGAEASAKAAVTDYEFTLIEIRLPLKGSGEGKTSLTTKVVLDNEARTVVLDDYAATPAILQNVKR